MNNLQSWWQRNVTARIRANRIKELGEHIVDAQREARRIFQEYTYKQSSEYVEELYDELNRIKESRINYLESEIKKNQEEIQEIMTTTK